MELYLDKPRSIYFLATPKRSSSDRAIQYREVGFSEVLLAIAAG